MLFFKFNFLFMIPVVLSLNDISNESSPSHDITEKDVKDFMTEFENLQSRGETLFNVVEAVAEYSMKCAEKSGPIGILMTKAAKALIDPKSSELAAIQLLSKFLLNATVDIYGEIGMISPQLHEIGDMAGWTPYVTAFLDSEKLERKMINFYQFISEKQLI